MKSPVIPTVVRKYQNNSVQEQPDLLVAEEPLEIRLKFYDGNHFTEKRLAVTMRTPGHDFELALGFLISEGIIASPADIEKIFYCEEIKSEEERENVVVVVLRSDFEVSGSVFNRNFYMTSSCGVCGKSSIESVHVTCQRTLKSGFPKVNSSLFTEIPDKVRSQQHVFEHTGGLHASALLTKEGEVLLLREDVGRHNALDKLIGARAASGKENADMILFVSGRVSFELVQKAFVSGIPILVAVGAPSSLAVSMAKDCGMTIIGFNRGGKFNVYCGEERIV